MVRLGPWAVAVNGAVSMTDMARELRNEKKVLDPFILKQIPDQKVNFGNE
jgi:hypothetical protein